MPLPPKAFRVLELLLERRPQAVSHEEFRRDLWPDTYVGGTTVARLVNEIRAAIGETKPGELIRTVHRFGYAFCGEAAEERSRGTAPSSGYLVQWGMRLLPLVTGENVIGRAPDAAISIASSKVSRRHARIVVTGAAAVLEDMGSRNGTYVGERRIEGPVELKDGDQIVIGSTLLIVHVSDYEAQTSTQGGSRTDRQP